MSDVEKPLAYMWVIRHIVPQYSSFHGKLHSPDGTFKKFPLTGFCFVPHIVSLNSICENHGISHCSGKQPARSARSTGVCKKRTSQQSLKPHGGHEQLSPAEFGGSCARTAAPLVHGKHSCWILLTQRAQFANSENIQRDIQLNQHPCGCFGGAQSHVVFCERIESTPRYCRRGTDNDDSA